MADVVPEAQLRIASSARCLRVAGPGNASRLTQQNLGRCHGWPASGTNFHLLFAQGRRGFRRGLREGWRSNLSVWQDIVALEGGRDWWSQIEDALSQRRCSISFSSSRRQRSQAGGPTRNSPRAAGGQNRLPGQGSGPRRLGNCRAGSARSTISTSRASDDADPRAEEESRQKRVPMMAPEPPADFVERPSEFDALKTQLLDAKGDAVAAITAALQRRRRLRQDDARQGARPRPRHPGRLFRRHPLGGAWREAGALARDRLRPRRAPDQRAAGARDPQRRGGETRRGSRRPPHPDVVDDAWREQDLRPLLQGGRTRPARHDADRQRPALDGRFASRSTPCRRARR